ncbi:hypothetical protein ARMGADRAFT_93480 [Armillaria gallica]|uniref:DUF1996 domain-containing protein n=1 Tax=Armillaria gallica TaxID=47427 RepID=A0A2H3CAH7_ARMGA|nr:hypothetical protein ARMGADRAFT_93480 [Armillaria gallica]
MYLQYNGWILFDTRGSLARTFIPVWISVFPSACGVFLKVRAVLGGSSFSLNLSTADLHSSECTSIPVQEDKSNHWYPHLYWQNNDGSFVTVNGSAVICTRFHLRKHVY